MPESLPDPNSFHASRIKLMHVSILGKLRTFVKSFFATCSNGRAFLNGSSSALVEPVPAEEVVEVAEDGLGTKRAARAQIEFANNAGRDLARC